VIDDHHIYNCVVKVPVAGHFIMEPCEGLFIIYFALFEGDVRTLIYHIIPYTSNNVVYVQLDITIDDRCSTVMLKSWFIDKIINFC
jgi:hypothetical protein